MELTHIDIANILPSLRARGVLAPLAVPLEFSPRRPRPATLCEPALRR